MPMNESSHEYERRDITANRRASDIELEAVKERMRELKHEFAAMRKDHSDIKDDLYDIKAALLGQQKFFAGVIFMATGIITLIGFGLNYFKH